MLTTLSERIRALVHNRKEVRYVLAGAMSESIEYLSFVVLYYATHMLYVSNSLSFGLGVFTGFVLHKTWSFRGEHRFKTRHQLIGYCLLAVWNFIAINVLVGYFVHVLGVWPAIAKLPAIAVTVSWTFLLSNKVIFKQHPNQ